MATIYWLGTADAVAQITTGTVTAFDVTTTYIVTIGGHTVSVLGNTSTTQTATDLFTALAASTDPYFTAVTWTNPSADTITGTAVVAGVPFVATLTVSGGTGTVSGFSDSTVTSGPNDWSTAANWSAGSIPANGDDVVIDSSSVNISWGLAQSGVTLDSLTIKKIFTGKIGLNSRAFATSIDAETEDATEVEYRQAYLNIKSDRWDIGENFGPSKPAGSQRIMMDVDANPGTIINIFDTSSTPSETGLPSIRILCNDATTDLFVRKAQGGVGIAVDAADEVSSIRKVSISDNSTTSRMTLSSGVTVLNYDQKGGINVLDAAATITTVDVKGGTLTSEGDYTVTTGTISGGTWVFNHTKTSGVEIATLTIDGGTLDANQVNEARTITTLNLNNGGTVKADPDNLTITTLNHEASEPFTLSSN